jgi:RimJ/RimL family protein N-acetyltransferase
VRPPDTARLRLRELRAGDLEDLARKDGDRRVMRYVGDGSTLSREAVARGLARSQRYYELYPGLGAWRAERADDGAFVGWFCLKYIPKTVEIEVGYRLVPDAWGRGYATEGAKAVVAYGFDTLTLLRIVGVTYPENVASQRVLVKAGLRDEGYGNYYGKRLRYFVADRSRPHVQRGAAAVCVVPDAA